MIGSMVFCFLAYGNDMGKRCYKSVQAGVFSCVRNGDTDELRYTTYVNLGNFGKGATQTEL